MADPLVVVFTCWNRPAYLKQVLASWARVRGVGEARLEFYCDPGSEETVELCRAADFADHSVTVNPVRFGDAENTFRAFTGAFTMAEYVILCCDDWLVSTDALELHTWYRDTYRHDQSAFALALGRGTAAPGGLPVVRREQRMGWVHGWHRDRWEAARQVWDAGALGGWWWPLNTLIDQRGWNVLVPSVSRAQDIGEHGIRPLPAPWATVQSASFTADVPPQDYREEP